MHFTKVNWNELSLCAVPANGMATTRLIKANDKPPEQTIEKQSGLTNNVDGHSHLVPRIQDDEGHTSYAYTNARTYGHDHPWVKDTNGNIIIGEAEGHTHTVAITN